MIAMSKLTGIIKELHVAVTRSLTSVLKSFFQSLKTERIPRRCYATRAAAQLSFSLTAKFYNRVRRQSTINYLSPNDHELQAGRAA